MRRTVLVPTMLVAMSLTALLVLALTLAAPVAAQEETTAQPASKAEASSCSTDADEVATFTTKDESFGPFRITAESFDVLYEAQEDRGSGPFRVAVTENGDTVTETAKITTFPVDDVLEVADEGPGSFSLDVEANDVDFAITVCEAGRTGGSGSANAGGDEGENGGDDAMAADELQKLGCDELLVLFRAEGSAQQYGDASGFADADVRAQIEVCLEEEIVEGTAADEDLPDTGGLSLIGLAVLGVVSAAAGLSVIRGGRR